MWVGRQLPPLSYAYVATPYSDLTNTQWWQSQTSCFCVFFSHAHSSFSRHNHSQQFKYLKIFDNALQPCYHRHSNQKKNASMTENTEAQNIKQWKETELWETQITILLEQFGRQQTGYYSIQPTLEFRYK